MKAPVFETVCFALVLDLVLSEYLQWIGMVVGFEWTDSQLILIHIESFGTIFINSVAMPCR